MHFVCTFITISVLQSQIWIAGKVISKDVSKIANIVLEFERVNKRNDGQTLTALPSALWRKNKPSVLNSTRDMDIMDIMESTSICSPWDSCVYRCSKRPRGLPYSCNCDYLCNFYGDCCSDYEQQCNSSGTFTYITSSNFSIASPTCETHLDFNWPIYVIRKCSSNWTCSETCMEFQVSSTHMNSAGNCRNKNVDVCRNNDTAYCREYGPRSCDEIQKDCEKNTNFTELVTHQRNYVFANPSCAACNGVYSFQKVGTGFNSNDVENNYMSRNRIQRILTSFRVCFSFGSQCSRKNKVMGNRNLSQLCKSHGGPVTGWNSFYKNVYCALCNGADPSTLNCPTWLLNPITMMSLEKVQNGVIGTFMDDGLVGLQITRIDIPAAFSILLNFGLDGRQRVVVSSETEENLNLHRDRCGKDNMWDPFSEICRKLYCSSEFVLENYRCVRRNEYDDIENENTEETKTESSEPNFVHLSLSMEISYLDLLYFYGMEHNISDIIADSLAKAFHVNIDRIQNVNLNITLGNFTNRNDTLKFIDEMEDSYPIVFSIDIDLYENPSDDNETEPTVDIVLSTLASALSVKEIELDIDTVKSKILEVHQTTGLLETWCNPAKGDMRREYWNAEFTLILSDGNSSHNDTIAKMLYVNSTQKAYRNGDFVVSILYQGYQMKKHSVNVSQLAVVCDRMKRLNESCIRVVLTKEEFRFFSNGTLELLNQSDSLRIDTQNYERSTNDSVLVCHFPLNHPSVITDYYLKFDFAQAMVSLVSLCISVIALTVVLITYLLFPSLRNLPGCNTMNLTFSLLAMQITFLFGQRRKVAGVWCRTVAQLLHYEILCSFMWMSVMAYDLYKTFGSNIMMSKIRSKRKFIWRYMIYAYGIPLIIMVICILLEELCDDCTMSPHYGFQDACWIANKAAAILFFAGPLALIMIVNVSLYILIIKEIRSIKHLVKVEAKNKQSKKNDLRLYIRMAFVTGLTWTLIFVAAYVPCDKIVGQIVIYVFIVANTLQGVYIFFAFICNKRVCVLYKNLLTRIRTKHETSSGILNWVSITITRSISTDTTISTISSSSTSSLNKNRKSSEGSNWRKSQLSRRSTTVNKGNCKW